MTLIKKSKRRVYGLLTENQVRSAEIGHHRVTATTWLWSETD